MTRTIMSILLAALLTACAATSIKPEEVAGPQAWGGASNVTQLRHLYFSEQPDEATFDVAQSRGVTTVVSLRDPKEFDWDERAAAERHGLRYVNIPIRRGEKSLNRDAIAAINQVVSDQAGTPVLLHCSSGNRASAWLATHLVLDHDMAIDDALQVARKTGLNSSGMEQRVRTYLDRRQ